MIMIGKIQAARQNLYKLQINCIYELLSCFLDSNSELGK